ncbi:MAG TPA: fibro-slime domain-containing protein [Polyangiales bacterium]
MKFGVVRWGLLGLLWAGCGEEPIISGTVEDDGHAEAHDAGPLRDARAPEAEPLDAARKPPVAPTGSTRDGGCATTLEITIRDFTEAHPDFEHFTTAAQGIVLPDLGPDRKPVYASTGGTPATTGPKEFAQWYNDAPGVNRRLSYQLQFMEMGAGVFVFDSSAFFPIDGMGFGNGPNERGIDLPLIGQVGGSSAAHNFLFTTEAHTVFSYRGGEKFRFSGDDDMWVFMNGKLAIDLGGAHSEQAATIDLDEQAATLGLKKGETYPIDIFHAERHTDQSNYHIETTIDLSCIENVVVPF